MPVPALSIDTVLREILREVVRDEVRAVVRDEITVALRGAGSSAAPGSAYLTTEEAAAVAKVEPATVRDWVRRGDLHRHHAGRELRVRRNELEAFLAVGRRSDGERSVDDIAMKILGKGNK